MPDPYTRNHESFSFSNTISSKTVLAERLHFVLFVYLFYFIYFIYILEFHIWRLIPQEKNIGNFNPMSPRAQFLKNRQDTKLKGPDDVLKTQAIPYCCTFHHRKCLIYAVYSPCSVMLLCSITDCMELLQLCCGEEGSQLHNELSSLTYCNPTLYSPAHPFPTSSVTETSIFYHVHQSRVLQSVDTKTWLSKMNSKSFRKSLTTPNVI